nr:hypothetical protein [Methyloglobulus morosus]
MEDFGQFFRHASGDSGMAFVPIPHLEPSHTSILPKSCNAPPPCL